jgi:hypothetical protein
MIAVVGAWVAVQQMLIARYKLNHDLFDRRFKIYCATQDFMIACLNHQGGSPEDNRAFYDAQRAAPFLFDRQINEFLVSLWKHSVSLQVYGPLIGKAVTAEKGEDYIQTYHKAQQWIASELDGVTKKLQTSLNLSNISPFPISGAVDIGDATKLKKRVDEGKV